MKKLTILLSALFVFGMALTSCGESTDNNGNDPFDKTEDTKAPAFSSAAHKFKILYSDDFLNLIKVSGTYTNFKGETTDFVLEPGKGELTIEDGTTTLPGSFKVEMKFEKNENFEEFLASKDKFNLIFSTLPDYVVGWVDQKNVEHVISQNTFSSTTINPAATAEGIKSDIDGLLQVLGFTWGGTIEKSGDNIIFKEIMD